MRRTRNSFVALMMTIAAGGTCLALGGCDVFGLAQSAVSSFNPCGTILACNGREYQFWTSGIDGPGVRPDIDPYCTFAPFCSAATGNDPIFGGFIVP